MTDDDDLLAGEVALGLLSRDEAAMAEARMRAEPELAARTEWWRAHLISLADDAATAPSPDVWRRIEARLGANDNRASATPWKWATAAMSVAATVLGVIALRPTLVVPVAVPQVPLVASLSGKAGTAVTVAYNAGDRTILVTPVTLEPGEGDAELWIIPIGQTEPISMGVINAKGAISRRVDLQHGRLLAPGATFAISQEARGGSPTGHAQGPIVATGKIIRI